MSAYHTFTSARLVDPDPYSLAKRLRAFDATAGVQHAPASPTYTVKKETAWQTAEILEVQNIIDTTADTSPRLTTKATILTWPIEQQALVYAVLDELNVIRARLVPPLPALTAGQFLNRILDKADTLHPPS